MSTCERDLTLLFEKELYYSPPPLSSASKFKVYVERGDEDELDQNHSGQLIKGTNSLFFRHYLCRRIEKKIIFARWEYELEYSIISF